MELANNKRTMCVEINLNRMGDPENFKTGIFCQPGTLLSIVLKASYAICLYNPTLWTNYPEREDAPFEADKFRPIPSAPYTGKDCWRAELLVRRYGSYKYYLHISEEHDEHHCDMGYFVVIPQLRLNDKPLNLGSICFLTMLSHCLGKIDAWEQHFRHAAKCKYNAIHFTPLSQSGQSGSPYSIKDQLQFSDIFFSKPYPAAEKERLISKTVQTMSKKYNLFPLTDIVWNHTAFDSDWLLEHPEATYNTDNCSYLKPALDLDRALVSFSDRIGRGEYANRGLSDIRNGQDVDTAIYILRSEIIPSLKLWEYFVINVEKSVKEFETALKSSTSLLEPSCIYYGKEVEVLKSQGTRRLPGGGRWCYTVDIAWALKLFAPSKSSMSDKNIITQKMQDYQNVLDKINMPIYEKLNKNIEIAIEHIRNRIFYLRLSTNKPFRTEISEKCPLIETYFTPLKLKSGSTIWAAHNGWIWGGQLSPSDMEHPLNNPYFTRTIIVWEDLVKLRYGKKPEDSPWLWKYIEKYTIMHAKIFSGFRIDNAHNTPLHVAEHFLNVARSVRPDLYVTAELFTGNEKIDQLYVSRLGLNSLIRESMQSSTSFDLGRQLHRYGGETVGSFDLYYFTSYYTSSFELDVGFVEASPKVPPALFYDFTHDNETIHMKRTPMDALSNSALTWMTSGPVGTTSGYDFLVPKPIPINETKLYPSFPEDCWFGIMYARKIINELHQRLANEGFTEIYIHQTGELMQILRHNPNTHQSVYCFAHCAFYPSSNSQPPDSTIDGVLEKYIMCATLCFDSEGEDCPHKFVKDSAKKAGSGSKMPQSWKYSEVKTKFKIPDDCISGQEVNLLVYDEEVFDNIFKLSTFENALGEHQNLISWKNFGVGSVLIVETRLSDAARYAHRRLKELETLESTVELEKIIGSIPLLDATYLLYNCDQEERSYSGNARGVYNVPGFGNLVYAGIQGFQSILKSIRKSNDLGHPLCQNLREGNWAMHYIVDRLFRGPRSLVSIAQWFEKHFRFVQALPRFLIPKYFDRVITKVCLMSKHHFTNVFAKNAHEMCGKFIENGDVAVSNLCLCSIQLVNQVPDVYLISPHILDSPQFKLTMAAGLPHFSVGYMRCWGRDIFISLRGLLLFTGRYDEARQILIAFAANLRHGLIPNLIDGSNNPRYNSRDATWWFMEALQAYCLISPEGHSFLNKKEVPRLYPSDDSVVSFDRSVEYVTMASIVQEIMERHAKGIHFRERNAGQAIDAVMQDRGFNIDISLDPKTGFIFGGNEFNCGTWMDKMGSNHQAHNFGIPATPRDGAAVEIIALLKSAVGWLSSICASGIKRQKQQKSSSKGNSSAKSHESKEDKKEVKEQSKLAKDDCLSDISYDQNMTDTSNSITSKLPPFFERKKSDITCSLPDFCSKKVKVEVSYSKDRFKINIERDADAFPWEGVTFEQEDGSTKHLSYAEWNELIQKNFEHHFYIPANSSQDSQYEINSRYVNRRGIYKDSYKSYHRWTDYQLRPNFCVAMVIAPELFSPQEAYSALCVVERHLLGPLGMKTLDPGDRQYHPNYDPASRNTCDYFTESGFNYHLGPEWVWPFGYYMRARLQFRLKSDVSILNRVQRLLSPHRDMLLSSWEGLPELTNQNGNRCWSSCDTQAWSAASILEALFDIYTFDTTNSKA
ncbi:glycogen debranching enzyme-like [Schistocerca gregaria]|uniref:glycogen debranching enzyme-like n=1 Tax=Schistocerca gregaria TaxID=7010 RepID=UPI00211EAD4A|nr:glycogen debranching enzyme-like [Schistocerca gregaria]